VGPLSVHYTIKQDSSGEYFNLSAGSASGIATKAKFHVYSRDCLARDQHLGEIEVDTPGLFESRILSGKTNPSDSLSNSSDSLLTMMAEAYFALPQEMNMGQVRPLVIRYDERNEDNAAIAKLLINGFEDVSLVKIVAIQAEEEYRRFFLAIANESNPRRGVRFEVEVAQDVGRRVISVPRCETHAPVIAKQANLRRVVTGMAHWHWHLFRSSPTVTNQPNFASQVELNMYKLQLESQGPARKMKMVWQRKGKNLIRKDGKVVLIVDNDSPSAGEPYGFEITNQTNPPQPVWVYLYYFSSSDFYISKLCLMNDIQAAYRVLLQNPYTIRLREVNIHPTRISSLGVLWQSDIALIRNDNSLMANRTGLIFYLKGTSMLDS
jgi:hypothetical protein